MNKMRSAIGAAALMALPVVGNAEAIDDRFAQFGQQTVIATQREVFKLLSSNQYPHCENVIKDAGAAARAFSESMSGIDLNTEYTEGELELHDQLFLALRTARSRVTQCANGTKAKAIKNEDGELL